MIIILINFLYYFCILVFMISKDEMVLFLLGLLVGGALVNLWVTAMYRIIDKNPSGNNWIIFIVSLLFFLGIICYFLFKYVF